VTIGLIGYGRFGSLAAKFLSRYGHVVVHDRRRIGRGRLPAKIREAPLAVVASYEIVVLAVPISNLEHILRSIAPFVQPHALILDVCSVKVQPVRWMKNILPRSANILGTHPLFGPDTVSTSVRGLRIVLCPVRISKTMVRTVKDHLQKAGLRVEMMKPERHDRMIAETLFLTQYVGRLVGHVPVRRWPRSTRTYEMLRWLADVAEHDSRTLFRDMFRFNPYAGRLLRAVDRAQHRIRGELDAR
jgi:prephenate dehydrogenase